MLLTINAMIKEDLKQGTLVPVLPNITADEVMVYLPKLDYSHTRTKLFLDHLKEAR